MDAKQYVYEIEMECFEIFKAQDPAEFDVIFEIDGKKLYADKYKLCKASPTFKAMLSDRWKSEIIKIKDYSFEDFKTFLTFIYSGECSFSDANIFAMVDIAEFYGVKVFKKASDIYLSKMTVSFENVIQFVECANKYSMVKMKEALNTFIAANVSPLIKCEHFYEKSAMKKVVAANQMTLKLEEFFEAVNKWAELQALKKQESDGSLNLDDAIKEELSDILPLFKYEEMNVEFLIKFVVKKSFLFSGEELSDILWAARGKVYVKVIDANGNILKGLLNCPEMDKVGDAIQSQKDILYDTDNCWKTKQTIPSEPSKITENASTIWYLVYDLNGDLALKHKNVLNCTHYILAEMVAESGFYITSKCKIEIYRYA
uniref:BTB domain-containing protein n=1 Tax=Panagrolaimus sp. ES5 TaxID=591445 RepID=A0AC34F6U2_9BILA